MRSVIAAAAVLIAVVLVAVGAFVYSGLYNMGADDPHWGLTTRVIEVAREQSLEKRASRISVPNLQDQQLILKGAGQYAAMCAGCHLAPGARTNELAKGLYPAPPELAKRRLDPRIAFVAIKHGIKMTGMPAWGGHHGDEQVWSLVAFVQKLPELTPQQYQEYIRSPAANAAAAMAAHGAMMPGAGAAASGGMEGMSHGPPGHHDMGR